MINFGEEGLNPLAWIWQFLLNEEVEQASELNILLLQGILTPQGKIQVISRSV